MTRPKRKLYLDMDGVLMDFDGELSRRGLQNNKSFLHKPKAQWSAEQSELFRKVCVLMNEVKFWRGLAPCVHSEILWDFCTAEFDLEVLTAIPPAELNPITAEIKQSKLNALATFFDADFPAERVNFCLREEKRKLAYSGAILVDDMVGNCEEWRANGGIAILHESPEQSIEILRKFLA